MDYRGSFFQLIIRVDGFCYCIQEYKIYDKFNPIFTVKKPGSDLLSHPVARAVPSALWGLTSVFGMGTGVAPRV